MASFPPLVSSSPDPRILILGSMPGQASLDQQQYYANPRNVFWWLMSQLLQRPLQSTYADRVEQLMSSGIAVWDVLYDCERSGSLDANIVRTSEQANKIANLLRRYSTIEVIGFNGAAALAIFKRHCQAELVGLPKIKIVQLPSTSPAHASMSKTEKLEVWRAQLCNYLPNC